PPLSASAESGQLLKPNRATSPQALVSEPAAGLPGRPCLPQQRPPSLLAARTNPTCATPSAASVCAGNHTQHSRSAYRATAQKPPPSEAARVKSRVGGTPPAPHPLRLPAAQSTARSSLKSASGKLIRFR